MMTNSYDRLVMENVVFKNLIHTRTNGNFYFGFRKEKHIVLKGISGYFRHGQLSAIIGASGAGKSSLLNVISRLRTTDVEGQVHCNWRRSCYITQETLHQQFFTVEELMNFSCKLKLRLANQESAQIMIDKALNNLNLNNVKHLTTDQLSGGERKRLSIALELVTNPSIFFLDEPTSGLDEINAIQSIRQLKKLAMQNHTVVCTIHQPSATMFDMFDQIYIIAQGQCVYQGTPKALVPFLNSLNINCPTTYNPADFVIELLEINQSSIEIFVEALENGTNTCDLAADNMEFKCTPIDNEDTHDVEDKIYDNSSSKFHQFIVLMQMMMIKIYRNRLAFYLQLIHYVICGLLFGLIYSQSINDGSRLYMQISFCFGISLCFVYTQYMVPVISYPLEVKIVKQEYSNRWYELLPYYAAFSLSRAPLQICFAIIFSTLIFTFSGFPFNWWIFSNFVLNGIISGFLAEGFGLFVGATFNVVNATAIAPMFCIPLMAMGTYGMDFATKMNPVMKFIFNLSFIRNGLKGLLLTLFGTERQNLECPNMFCYFQNPKTILRQLDMLDDSIWAANLNMIFFTVVFRVLFFISLKFKLSS